MDERERDTETRKDFWDNVGDTFEALWRALGRLLREGNRRQLALRDRKGAVLVRLPLTIAALIGLFLLWKVWPLLLLLVIVLFALRGSVVILRRETTET
ncbi:MAG: DUF4342 domain-containing protein [Acidobacteriota bacterium]